MHTIIDYLKYYKDITLKEVHWNIMDNLMCSILIYLPIETFNNYKNINELYDYALNYKSNINTSKMAPISYEILELIKNSIRYKSLLSYNLVNTKNDDTQFGAITFRIENKTIISYKGTDGSLIGWIENFRIGYDYPTYTHTLAIKYLNSNIKFNDKEVYVVGHSKGGNLAMVSAMETASANFNKIKKVYNFDGPGFRKEEYKSLKYRVLSKKLVNIVPSGSIVGILLNNNNYKVIKSNNIAIGEHYPTSWNMFGEFFIESRLSKISMHIHESTTKGIENLSNEKMKEAFETIFKNFEKEYSRDFNITFEDIIKFYKNMKKIDPEVSKYIDDIINSLITYKNSFIKK